MKAHFSCYLIIPILFLFNACGLTEEIDPNSVLKEFKPCLYAPFSEGISYEYENQYLNYLPNGIDTVRNPYTISIGNKYVVDRIEYIEVQNFWELPQKTLCNCVEGEYQFLIQDSSYSTEPVALTFLKEHAAIDETWVENTEVDDPVRRGKATEYFFTYQGEIDTMIVGGIKYVNVKQVHLRKTNVLEGGREPSFRFETYYWAAGVGLIEIRDRDPGVTTQLQSHNLDL